MPCVYKVLEFSNRVVKKEKQFLAHGTLGFVEEANINTYIFNIKKKKNIASHKVRSW